RRGDAARAHALCGRARAVSGCATRDDHGGHHGARLHGLYGIDPRMTIATALLLMLALTALALVAMRWAAHEAPAGAELMIERVNELLPQTQCGRCTFAGCRPYAT